MPEGGSPFGSWNGVEAFEFVDGVRLHAIGGDQVLLCRVQYEPGKQVPRHAHEHTEQLMCVVEGSVTMTIGDETRELGPGDVVCVNRGIEHELHSAGGVMMGLMSIMNMRGGARSRPRLARTECSATRSCGR